MDNRMHVELIRPERRFGWAIVVWRNDPFTGKRVVLHYDEDGVASWDEIESNVELLRYTYWMDEEVLEALRDLAPPAPKPDPGVFEVLESALTRERQSSDRLFSLMEHVVKHVTH